MGARRATKWKRLRELSIGEWTALLQATIAVPLVVLSLKALGLRKTQRGLARLGRPKPPLVTDPSVARRYARVITIVGSHGLVRPNCLQRSLVLWTMLRRRHMDPDLRIGVSPPSSTAGLRFHAWIELAGEVVNDSPKIAEEFRPFEATIEAAPGAFD